MLLAIVAQALQAVIKQKYVSLFKSIILYIYFDMILYHICLRNIQIHPHIYSQQKISCQAIPDIVSQSNKTAIHPLFHQQGVSVLPVTMPEAPCNRHTGGQLLIPLEATSKRYSLRTSKQKALKKDPKNQDFQHSISIKADEFLTGRIKIKKQQHTQMNLSGSLLPQNCQRRINDINLSQSFQKFGILIVFFEFIQSLFIF